ncbi:MAG: extracellular solute-binding protein [Lachnospiraceae bacterium]|nr:extracellular solute-binding protein [Lachnospiraceae bacterium]
MKKNIISILTAIAVFSVMLSGCGSVNTSEETTEALSAQESTESASDKGTIALRVWGAEEDKELLEQIVENFEQEYGSYADFDITIEAQSEADCKNTLLSDLENGADVFTFVDDQLMSLVAAGALVPVDNTDEVKAANSEDSVSTASINDTLYAYPLTADNGYFMYYNKAVIPDTDTGTLDQMLADAAANGKKVYMDWTSGWYLYSFFANTGMELGLNEDGISNHCNWNTQDGTIKGVDVANAMLTIAANPGFISTSEDEFIAGATNGSIVAGVSGVWNAQALQAAWGDNFAATKLPTYTVAGQQIQMGSFSGYKMVGVNAYSKHTDWALKLADWISNEQNQMLRFEMRGQGPCNINVAKSEAVMNSPAIQAVLAQNQYATVQRIGGNYWEPVQEFGTEMAANNSSGKDLQTLLDNMVDEITISNAK